MQATDRPTEPPAVEPAADAPGRELVGRMITLSGLLAGFAFTALIQLIALDDSREVMALTILFCLLSAVTYILSLFSFVSSSSIALPSARATAASVELFAFYIFWVATVSLLITMALAGWLHSTLVGAAGAVIALLTLAGLAALLFIRGNVR